jgi:hypothetical protein
MTRTIRTLLLAATAAAVTAVVPTLHADDTADADEAAIRQAVLNYANSAYLVKPELVEESVHPKLQKIGYARRDPAAEYRELWMNFYELKELVSKWNQDGKFDPETAKREVRILDRLDRTAVARLDAEWGIDFFQLAKIDGEWKIMNVLWQTYPVEEMAEAGESEGEE